MTFWSSKLFCWLTTSIFNNTVCYSPRIQARFFSTQYLTLIQAWPPEHPDNIYQWSEFDVYKPDSSSNIHLVFHRCYFLMLIFRHLNLRNLFFYKFWGSQPSNIKIWIIIIFEIKNILSSKKLHFRILTIRKIFFLIYKPFESNLWGKKYSVFFMNDKSIFFYGK